MNTVLIGKDIINLDSVEKVVVSQETYKNVMCVAFTFNFVSNRSQRYVTYSLEQAEYIVRAVMGNDFDTSKLIYNTNRQTVEIPDSESESTTE